MAEQSFLQAAALFAHEAMKLGEQAHHCAFVQSGLSHPGFIGSNYKLGDSGTLVIGMNRGGSSASRIDPMEADCLQRLQNGPSSEAFTILSSRCFALLPQWNLWSRNLLLLFSQVGLPLQTVAYIHAVPFRVQDNRDLPGLYKRVWNEFTIRYVDFLRPARVIFAGMEVGKHLSVLVDVPSRIVPRTGRDIARPNPNGTPHARSVARAHNALLSEPSFWM